MGRTSNCQDVSIIGRSPPWSQASAYKNTHLRLCQTHRNQPASEQTPKDVRQGTRLDKTASSPAAIVGYTAASQREHHLPPVSHLKHHVHRLRQRHLHAAKTPRHTPTQAVCQASCVNGLQKLIVCSAGRVQLAACNTMLNS